MPNPFEQYVAEENPLEKFSTDAAPGIDLAHPSTLPPAARAALVNSDPGTAIPMGIPAPRLAPEPGIGETISQGLRDAGQPFKAVIGDIASGIPNPFNHFRISPETSGNIPAALRGEPLPIDQAMKDASEVSKERGDSQFAPAMGKAALGLASQAPLLMAGAGLPANVAKIIGAGFVGKTIAQDAPQTIAEIMTEKQKPEDQQDPDRLSTLYSDAAQEGLILGVGGLALPKNPGRNVALTKGDAFRIGVRDLAGQVKDGEMQAPEIPSPIRQTEFPNPEMNPLAAPWIRDLAERGLAEAQPGNIQVPGEAPAVDLIRAERLRPLAERSVVEAERQRQRNIETGDRVGGGNVSFAGEGIPNSRQSRVGEIPDENLKPSTEGVENAPQKRIIEEGNQPEYSRANPGREGTGSGGGDRVLSGGGEAPAKSEAINTIDQAFDAGKVTNATSIKAGLEVRSVEDLNALLKKYDELKANSKKLLQEKDFNGASMEAFKIQILRETIETATNSGSWKEGEGSIHANLGDRPLDASKVPEANQWLQENGKKIGIEPPKIPEPTVEGVTPLDPATGQPLSATDSLINKVEAPSQPTARKLSPEQERAQTRAKNIADRAEAKLAEIQKNIRSGKYAFSGVTGLEPLAIDGALTVARATLKATSSVIQAIEAATKYIQEKYPNAKFNREELADWINEKVYGEEAKKSSPKGETPPAKRDVPTAPEADLVPGDPQRGILARAGDAFRNVRDFVSIDPVPKLTRMGVQNEAVQHAYARAAVPRMVDDFLSRVFPEQYKNPEAMAKTMDILNKDNILGGYDEFLRRAEESLTAGDQEGFRKWTKRANDVGSAQDLAGLEKEVSAARENPEISSNIKRWKELVNPELDRLYNEIKGVNPLTEREGRGRVFGARVNLLPKSEEGKWIKALGDDTEPLPQPSSSNYRNPNAKADRFDRMAKFTGDYSDNPAAVLSNVLAPRWNEVTKIRFYDSLVKSGRAQWVERGESMPESIHGEPVSRLPVKVPETNEEGVARQVEKVLAVPQNAVSEIRGILDTDLRLKQNPVGKALTTLQIAQLSDAVTHMKNLHSVVTSAQGTKSFWTDIAKKMPGISTLDAAGRITKVIYDISQSTPGIRAEMADMARNGMLRESYPATGVSKITRMQDAIHSVDTASRTIMNRFYDNLIERGLARDDMVQRRKFVQQVGEYNKRLMSPMMQAMSRSGLSPFIVAGRNFNRFGKRALTGSYGFEAASPRAAVQMRLTNLATLASIFVIPMMVNYVAHKNIFGRPGTPLGAIDIGGGESMKGTHKILDLAQLYGVRRGMRATGVEAISEGLRRGNTPSEIIDKGVSDVASTAGHPWMGPALGFGYSALTGSRLDLRGGPNPVQARKVGAGESQAAENARVALKNQNPALYSVLQPLLEKTGYEPSEYAANVIHESFLKAPYSALGVRDVKSPALQMANETLRSKIPVGGTSKERSEERASESDAISKIHEGKLTLEEAIASGKIPPGDVNDVRKKLSQTPLQYAIERLTADEAKAVYSRSSDDEKKQIETIVRIKSLAKEGAEESQKRAEEIALAIGGADTLEDAARSFVARNGPDKIGVHHLIEAYTAKASGATREEARLISLPVQQRAKFISEQLQSLGTDARVNLIRDYARKRIITRAVAEELDNYLTNSK